MEFPFPLVSRLMLEPDAMVEWLMLSFDMLDEELWANPGTAKAAARVGTRSNIIGSFKSYQTHD